MSESAYTIVNAQAIRQMLNHDPKFRSKADLIELIEMGMRKPEAWDKKGSAFFRVGLEEQFLRSLPGTVEHLAIFIKSLLRDNGKYHNVKVRYSGDSQLEIECGLFCPVIVPEFSAHDRENMARLRQECLAFKGAPVFATPAEMYEYFQRDNATPPPEVTSFIDSFVY